MPRNATREPDKASEQSEKLEKVPTARDGGVEIGDSGQRPAADRRGVITLLAAPLAVKRHCPARHGRDGDPAGEGPGVGMGVAVSAIRVVDLVGPVPDGTSEDGGDGLGNGAFFGVSGQDRADCGDIPGAEVERLNAAIAPS